MKTKFKSRTNLRKIRNLHDLELEKARLQLELVKSEEQIHISYKRLLDQLTFRNIIQKVADEVTMTTTVVSKAIAIGKDIFGKIRKKKKKWKERHESAPVMPGEQVDQQDPPLT